MTQFFWSMVALGVLSGLIWLMAWRDAKKRASLSKERTALIEAQEAREREWAARSAARRRPGTTPVSTPRATRADAETVRPTGKVLPLVR